LRLRHGRKQTLHAIGQGDGRSSAFAPWVSSISTTARCRARAVCARHRLTGSCYAPQHSSACKDFRSCSSAGPAPEKHPAQSPRQTRSPVMRRRSKNHRLVLVDKLLEIGLPVTGHKSLLPTIPQECAGWMQRVTQLWRKSSERQGAREQGAREQDWPARCSSDPASGPTLLV